MVRFLQVIFLFIFISSFAQTNSESSFLTIEEINNFKIPDSLKEISFEELKNKFYQDSLDSHERLYAKTYIKKGVNANDSLEVAKGYYLLYVISKDSVALSLLDKGLEYSKNRSTEEYPAVFYYNKGDFYFDHANYKEALNNYFVAFNLAKKNNPFLAYNTKFNIGSLKSRIGKYEEALEIFKEFYNYVLSEDSEYPKEYYHRLIPMISLSDTYMKLNILDTATVINKEGIKIALANNDKDMYHYFVMNEGVNLFFKKNYTSAIDSLKKAIPTLIKLNDKSNMIFTRSYLGKSYLEKNKKSEAIIQFKKVDSLFKDYKGITPEIRETYKILIDFYRTNEDKENQLIFLNKLIKVDSILNTNHKYLNERIIKDFDTKNLVLEKEKLISDLHQSNTFKSGSIISLFIGLIIVSTLLLLNYRKRQGYKRKFEELISQKSIAINNPKGIKEKQVLTNYLSEDIISAIESGLEKFESNKGYLNQNVSISSLAKSIDTNSKYLSVYINQYQQKKFTDYINDLRILDTIERLKTNHKFRKYTIKAISETVGFSNPISFSQAFYKKTGIKPSYFIKELENSSGK
ncbi:helix-turn-helix domain-containing protein [Aquimarina celericrescens]|nr:helix-turn-helix domain-containing protein [Aquimarina celericrescens]